MARISQKLSKEAIHLNQHISKALQAALSLKMKTKTIKKTTKSPREMREKKQAKARERQRRYRAKHKDNIIDYAALNDKHKCSNSEKAVRDCQESCRLKHQKALKSLEDLKASDQVRR